MGSDQTLGDALDTAEGKLVVARQICKQYCPLALVPWSATLPGCRRRILQLWLDLLLAYERGLLLEGSFADISVKKAGISRQLIEKYKQDCVNRAEFFFGLRGDWWPPICEFVDIWSGDSDNLLQVDFDGETFGKALKKQAPAPAQAAALAASSQGPEMRVRCREMCGKALKKQAPSQEAGANAGGPAAAPFPTPDGLAEGLTKKGFMSPAQAAAPAASSQAEDRPALKKMRVRCRDEGEMQKMRAKSQPRKEAPKKRAKTAAWPAATAAAWPAATGEVQMESGVT